jgi:hypothetical protein
MSVEAYKELKSWMDYRLFSGELIDEDSWLMRDLWDTGIIQGKGFVTRPNKLSQIGIKKLINRAIWAQGPKKTRRRQETTPVSSNPLLQKMV